METVLPRYDIFIWAEPADTKALVETCLQATWDDGHSAHALLSHIGRTDVEKQMEAADIVVCLCRRYTDQLRQCCDRAAMHQKPVLIVLVNSEPDLCLRDFEKLTVITPIRDPLCIIPSDNDLIVAKEYLVYLHSIVRQLDSASRPQYPSRDPWAGNRLLQRLQYRMAATALNWRCDHNWFLKTACASFFLDMYLAILTKAKISRMFFESGSSIAYLSEALAARMDEEWLKASSDLEIETNNILSYLEFMFVQSVRVSLYPPGPPETKYGATFGPLRTVDEPSVRHARITNRARDIMHELRDHFADLYADNGIIFGATSGIDIDNPERRFRGPHVGSYANRLMKRSIIESGCPVVLLLDEDKIPYRFIAERCFSVCDEDFTWQRACATIPLALTCAFHNRSKADLVLEQLEPIGFTHVEHARESETPLTFIASNDKFWQVRDRWVSAGVRAGNRNIDRGVRDLAEPDRALLQ